MARRTVAQRNDACYALRGQRSVEVVDALGHALADKTVRACAARDLREAGAVDALIAGSPAAMRRRGWRRRGNSGSCAIARAFEALGRAALSENVLLASSAIYGAGRVRSECGRCRICCAPPGSRLCPV